MRQLSNIELGAIHGGFSWSDFGTLLGTSTAGAAIGGLTGFGYLCATFVPGRVLVINAVRGGETLLLASAVVHYAATVGLVLGLAAGCYLLNNSDQD